MKTLLRWIAWVGVPLLLIVSVRLPYVGEAAQEGSLCEANPKVANFNFTNSFVTASSIGTLEFTEGWNFNNFRMWVTKKALPVTTGAKEDEERLK